MIHSDVEPISPVYASESAEGEQATGASGAGDGGDPSSAEGELVEAPEAEEVQQQASMPSPALPSHSERMEHRITHLPYRSWCDECVEAFGRERSHHAASLEKRMFPLVSIDYMFLTPKGLILKGRDGLWEDPPEDSTRVLAGICSATKVVFAFAVPQKGADAEGHAVKNLVENVLWLGHSRVAVTQA